MTNFDLFDSIGNVDDELIEKAAEPKKSGKKAFWAITSVAACAVLACAVVFIVRNVKNSSNVVVDSGASSAVGTSLVRPVDDGSYENGVARGENSEIPVQEDSEDIALEEMPFEIYYAANGKMEHKAIVTDSSPQNLFDIWKKENHIGDEVHFISAKFSDNGTTELSEYSGIGVAAHKAGNHTVYTLTITPNLEKYYDSIGKELLLDSLEKTMTGMCDPKPDEYCLILSDNTENEQTESIISVSNDKQNREDVVGPDAYTDMETSPIKSEAEGSFDYVASSGISQEYTPDKLKAE